ncbi:MAG: Cardiolipin synthetase, partial [uncultured Nocardioidaceae bacterium]
DPRRTAGAGPLAPSGGRTGPFAGRRPAGVDAADAPPCGHHHVRAAAGVRDRPVAGRLLPPPRQEAEAVPDDAADRGDDRRGHDQELHLRRGPLRGHARGDRTGQAPGAARVLHLEGRRDRRAVQAGPARRRLARGGRLRDLRRLREPGRLPPLPDVPPARARAPVPRLHGRAALLRPASLRARPPEDPGGRRRGRLRRRLQHRLPLRHGVARHPRAHHRPGGVGPDQGVRRLLEPPPPRTPRRAAAPGDPVGVGAADPRAPQRPAAVDVPDPVDVHGGDQPGDAQRVADPGVLHPRLGLRRCARGGRPARCRRAGAAPPEVEPHRGRLDLAGLLRRDARRRHQGVPVRRGDGARQDRDHRRSLEHRGHREHRPALDDRQLRGERRIHRPRHGPAHGADLRGRPPELQPADGRGLVRPAGAQEGRRAFPGTAAPAAV